MNISTSKNKDRPKITPHKIRGHLKTINQHKAKVTRLCLQCGLIRQGLKHDLSKYSWQELKTGFTYFQGYRSPIDAQKEAEGFSASWLHHKGRNPHHWEYWLDFNAEGIYAVAMPFEYVVEMFCDRVAASMIYQKGAYTDASPLLYYLNSRGLLMIHPQTDRQILYLLDYLSRHGLENTIRRIRLYLQEYKKTGQVSI